MRLTQQLYNAGVDSPDVTLKSQLLLLWQHLSMLPELRPEHCLSYTNDNNAQDYLVAGYGLYTFPCKQDPVRTISNDSA